jgi:hypothetical protein
VGLFGKKTIADRLIRQFGASACGPNVRDIDEMLDRISSLTSRELDLLPFTGDDIAPMYPNAEAGFNAAFDTALMRGRIDAVVACQDAIGAVAEKSVSRIRPIPRDKTCGPALISVQAVTAVIVRDLVGMTFDDEDRRRGSNPPFFIPKATAFTQTDFDNAVAPWVIAFGKL